jgi:hypothetical protein
MQNAVSIKLSGTVRGFRVEQLLSRLPMYHKVVGYNPSPLWKGWA